MIVSDFHLRPIPSHEVENLVRLTDEVGWGFTRSNWQIALAAGQNFALYDDGGEIAATSAIFRYGNHLAVLGNIIVREKYRGHGLATRVIDAAEKGVDLYRSPIMLVSTPFGEPVYRGRGYRIVGECTKLVRPAVAQPLSPPDMPGYRFKPVTASNLEDILEFDQKACKADRGQVLTAMLKAGYTSVSLHRESNDQLCGFALAYPRKNNIVIGPVIAEEAKQASALIQMLGYGREEDLRLDILSHQSTFLEDVKQIGFLVKDISPVMMLGKGKKRIQRDQAFVIISQSFG